MGSDARGNIRFNWRIIQTPTRLIDYVVAHELIHLAHPNHTRDFIAGHSQVYHTMLLGVTTPPRPSR